jgi:hypothetical protein
MDSSYTREHIKKDIGLWLSLVRQCSEDRDAQGMDHIIEPLRDAEGAYPDMVDNMSVHERKFAEDITYIFGTFCIVLQRNASLKNEGVADSVRSMSYILYLLDFGWSIMNDLVRAYYTTQESIDNERVAMAHDLHAEVHALLSARRAMLLKLETNSYQTAKELAGQPKIDTHLSYEDTMGLGPVPHLAQYDPKEAYNALTLLGLGDTITTEELTKQIKQIMPVPSMIGATDVTQLIRKILEENHKILSFTSSWTPQEVFQKIKDAVPQFDFSFESCDEVRAPYEGGEAHFYEAKLNVCGEHIEGRLSHSLHSIAEWLNPVLGPKLQLNVFGLLPNYGDDKDIQKLAIVPLESVSEARTNIYIGLFFPEA